MAEPTVAPTPEPQAEEFKSPLDIAFESEMAEVNKLLNENPTQVSETTIVETPEVPAKEPETPPEPIEEPPVETPPIEVKVEEPPVETPPAEKPPEREKGPWRELREVKRQLAAEKRAREELEAKIAKPPVETIPGGEDELDPIERVSRKQEELERQIKANTEAEQQRQVRDSITRAEELFKRDHPDYDEATKHVAAMQRDEYELSGMLDNLATKIQRENPDNVGLHFDSGADLMTNQPFETEDDAAKDLAYRVLLNADRQRFVSNILTRGGNVAEAAYKLAQRRGYQPKSQTPPPPQTTPPAQQRVQQAARAAAASASLSSINNSGAPRENQIKTRDQLLALDTDERERLILEMDQKQPGWDRELA